MTGILITFVVSVLAGVTANIISKWLLDRHDSDND